MFFPIKNRSLEKLKELDTLKNQVKAVKLQDKLGKQNRDLEKLKELDTLKNQVKAVKLQDKLGKQNFHENIKTII